MALSQSLGPEPNPGDDLFEGTPYRAIERLRAGGMGEVFLVEHRATGRRVVAKLIHAKLAADPRLMERLRIEAQSLAELDHHHIVRILGLDKTRTHRPFIVLEYLVGRTLADELKAAGPPHVLEALSFASHLLSAVAAAHEKGLVHRDIKPDNIFLCELSDGRRFLKLLDFGVVKVMSGSDAVEPMPFDLRTNTGVVVGTPRYVSPEGAMGEDVDERADLYSVGLVLYAMLVGRGPFDHLEGDDRLLHAHALEAPEPPSRYSLEPIPQELDRAVLKALAKDPNDRFQTADEFQACLVQIADSVTRPAGWLETLAFDATGMLNPPDDSVSTTAPSTASTNEVSGEHGARMPPEEAAPLRTTAATEPQAAPRESRRMSVGSILLFVAGMLIAGLAIVGLVTIVEGARP
jgi:eukaryotic-like serine/threonine-protein kinase